MNKQIADILNQPAFDRLKDWHDIGPVQKATLELFAELLIKECALIAFHNVVNLSSIADAEDVEANIKQHFGVEE